MEKVDWKFIPFNQGYIFIHLVFDWKKSDIDLGPLDNLNPFIHLEPTTLRIYENYIVVNEFEGRGFASIGDCVDASVQGYEKYIKKSKERLGRSLRGVRVKVLDYSSEVSEFELQLYSCVQFRINTFGKCINPHIPTRQ